MIIAADLPDTIPVFPLPGALLLPRARLPLHIFEPRYLAMLDDTLKTLAPADRHGAAARGDRPRGPKRLHTIGCAGRLTAFSETEDGRYMITLSGISRFRIRAEVEGFTPYRPLRVSTGPGSTAILALSENDEGFDRDRSWTCSAGSSAPQDLSTDWESLKEAEDELLINSLSMLCPFEPEDKQALLEAPSLVDAARDAGDADRVRPARRQQTKRSCNDREVRGSTAGCSRRWSARRPTACCPTMPDAGTGQQGRASGLSDPQRHPDHAGRRGARARLTSSIEFDNRPIDFRHATNGVPVLACHDDVTSGP